MSAPEGTSPDPGSGPGLFVSLRSFWSVVVAIFYTRLDLVTSELQEEGTRLGKFIVSSLLSLLFFHTAFFFAMFFIIALSWETPYRFWVIGGIFAVYFLGGLILLLIARELIVNRPKFLSQTLAELRRDVEGLSKAVVPKKEEPKP